jgi:hypothetical protein
VHPDANSDPTVTVVAVVGISVFQKASRLRNGVASPTSLRTLIERLLSSSLMSSPVACESPTSRTQFAIALH